jgi:hypothetical protein
MHYAKQTQPQPNMQQQNPPKNTRKNHKTMEKMAKTEKNGG